MSLLKDSALRSVLGIGPEELKGACMFLQGAVYCWCKNRPQEWFALRDLMGARIHTGSTLLSRLFTGNTAVCLTVMHLLPQEKMQDGY